MKSFRQPGTGRPDQGRFVRYVSGMVAALGFAFIVGDMVAHEAWRYLALLAVVALALCWPLEVALGTYVFTVPFNAVTALGESSTGTTLNWVLGALAGTALLSVGIITKRLHWPSRPALWAALFAGWALLSSVWSLRLESAEHWIPTAASLALLYLVASSWKLSERQFSILTRLIIAGGCLAAGYTVFQYARGVTWVSFMGTTTRGSLVIEGREVNPNSLGTDLLLPFSLATAWFFSARSKLSSLLGLCAASVIVAAVFVTISRGSILSACVVMAVFFLRLNKKRRMLLIGTAVLAAALLMPGSFFSRLKSSIHDAGSGRLDIWSVGFDMVKHHGITGVGLANFPVLYDQYAGRAPRFVGYGRGAHNIYLETAVEFGIVGMFFLVAALFSHIRTVRRLWPKARSMSMQIVSLEAACWAMVVAGLFEAIIWDKSFWLTWMLCLMAAQLQPRAVEAPAPTAEPEKFWQTEFAEHPQTYSC